MQSERVNTAKAEKSAMLLLAQCRYSPRDTLRDQAKMDNLERHWTVARLEQRVEYGADASQIADVVILMWQLTETILNPILGEKSVDALFQRSLFLTGQVYPWLGSVYGGVQSSTDFAVLKSVVTQQDGADAAAGAGALLQTFYDMLIRLIGSAVTERLLRSIWETHLSGQPAQDHSPRRAP